MVAGVGGEAGRPFVFQKPLESLQQRQSNLLERARDLHSVSVHAGLKQAVLFVAEVSTQHRLDKEKTFRIERTNGDYTVHTRPAAFFEATGWACRENCMMDPSPPLWLVVGLYIISSVFLFVCQCAITRAVLVRS